MLKQTETQNYQRAKTIKEIIHYVYEDGSEIMDAYTATLRFNQFGVKKANDKDIVWDTNIPAKVFPPVLSPNVAGYQADIMSIPKQRIALKPEDFAKSVLNPKGFLEDTCFAITLSPHAVITFSNIESDFP